MSDSVKIVEVGPRDGLQNENVELSVEQRVAFIRKLVDAGLSEIETGAFVSPKWVPRMAGSEDVYKGISKDETGKRFISLVPNAKGLERGLSVKIKNIAVFTSVSESFSQKNTNCSIEESYQRVSEVVQKAKESGVSIRGYLSASFYCPYEGYIEPKRTLAAIQRMANFGVYEISIGDTVGAATPKNVRDLLKIVRNEMDINQIAMHFHDTRGMAVANILESLNMGVRVFDSSLGGLGGCPYAPGARGNVATEDVVYFLNGEGVETGVDLLKLIEINKWMSSEMKKELPSRVGQAGLPQS